MPDHFSETGNKTGLSKGIGKISSFHYRETDGQRGLQDTSKEENPNSGTQLMLPIFIIQVITLFFFAKYTPMFSYYHIVLTILNI